jgi:hypothetical protein
MGNPIDVGLESFDQDMEPGDLDAIDDAFNAMNGNGLNGGGVGSNVMTGQEEPPNANKASVKRRGSNAHKRKSSAGGRLPSMPEEEEPASLSQQQQQFGSGKAGGERGCGMDVDGDQGMSPLSASSEGEGSEEGALGMGGREGVQRGRTETRVGGAGW